MPPAALFQLQQGQVVERTMSKKNKQLEARNDDD
jgi:hypothetical protein